MSQKRWIASLLSIAIVVTVVAAPAAVLGTKTYPVTVVNGNSMVPTFQNGDVVIFRSVDSNKPIPTGTIIVFIPSNFGLSSVDYLVKPSVVHRVVGMFRQFDGVLYYTTKGDNNQQNDTTLVRASNVLGVSIAVVPKAGLAFSFLSSPQGLITIVGATAFLYLERSNQKSEVENRKKRFLGKLAGTVIQGGMSEELFRKVEMAINYGGDLDPGILDERIVPVVNWVRKGGLKKYSVTSAPCPECSEEALVFGEEANRLVVCRNRISNPSSKVPASFKAKIPPVTGSEPTLREPQAPAVTARGATPDNNAIRSSHSPRLLSLGKSATILVYPQLIVIILLLVALSWEYSSNAFMRLWFSENAAPLGYLLANYVAAVLVGSVASTFLLIQNGYWRRKTAKVKP